jgi:hypothetical protein
MHSCQPSLIPGLLIISYFCASLIHCYSNDLSMKLPTPGELTCTAHVKYFPSDTTFEPKDAFNSFVLSNKDSSLFTLWSNESLVATPVIQFFEQCSVNVLFKNLALHPKTSSNFLKNMNFYGNGPLHSVYIFIQWNCDDEIENEYEALGLDLNLYLHYLNRTCESVPKVHGKFPRFRLLPFRIPRRIYLKRLPRDDSESSNFIKKPKLNKNYKPNCISSLGKEYYLYSCLNLRVKHICTYRHFLLSHLEAALNFTCRIVDRAQYDPHHRHRNPFGLLMFDDTVMITIMRFSKYAKPWMPEGLLKTHTAYCDFKGSGDRLKIQAWTNPMELHVWVALGVSVLLCAAVSCTLEANSGWASNAFILIGIVLRQYSAAIQRSILLTAVGIAALTLTSMYENFITIELIAPTKALLATDLGQLALDKKYRIYVQSYEDTADRVRISYLNEYVAEDPRKKRLLTEENVIFFNYSTNPSFDQLGDMKRKAGILIGAPFGLETAALSVVRNMNPSRECNYVKTPNAIEPILAVFRNSFASEQITIINYFLEAGILNIWKNSGIYLSQLHAENMRRNADSTNNELDEGNEDYLTLINLISIFTVWGVMTGVAFVVCLVELFTMRKSKSNSVNSVTDLEVLTEFTTCL